MKNKISLITLSLLLVISLFKAQTTPAEFFGVNSWMPDSVKNTFLNGKVHKSWAAVKNSNVKLVRFGGTLLNDSLAKTHQYLKMVDSIRNRGMEPILQVPYVANVLDSATARALVKYINTSKGRKVKYWVIGNEPTLNAIAISSYIKRMASAMKNQDPTIKIIGPGLKYMPGDQYDPARAIIDSLCSLSGSYNIMGSISGYGGANGKPYIDYFSYHMYNFEGTNTTPKRVTLIDQLTATSKDTAAMGYIKRKCDFANTWLRGSQPIEAVMTEANICYYSASSGAANDNFRGVKSSSFFAGQHIAELNSWGIKKGLQWINFWSVLEGNRGGYLKDSVTKKSTYYHLEQMAKWFKGTHYIAVDDSNGGSNVKRIKAFASKTGAYIAVMILNQDSADKAEKPYNIALNSGATGTGIRINVGISGVTATHQDTIKASSTTLLIFNCAGSLAYKYRYEQNDSLNPFKSMPVSSPVTLLTVDAGADKGAGLGCSATFNATTNQSGTFTYAWSITGSSQTGTGSSFVATNSTGLTQTVTVVITNVATGCTATDYALLIHSSRIPPCNGPELGKIALTQDSNIETVNLLSSLQSLEPNPTDSKVTVRYTLAQDNSQAQLILMNYSGQQLANYNLKSVDNKFEIDCSSLPAGLYFTTLIVDGKKVSTKKLIVTK
ncbi:MAG: T9SS type A sorting domain-containing protein [Bacteroidetes bacterium]|nr:T9SS type A sorting domain-containing protein [Bacteroidota bacterium]